MEYICSQLDNIGVQYKSKIAGTGVLVQIDGEKESNEHKTLLIRADMDALPIQEVSDKEYASQNDGSMHACGHDAHTAVLLETCRVLNEFKEDFSGTVKLVFQPGEETRGGAKPMIDSGILKNPNVDACIALHMDSDIQAGKIRVKPVLCMRRPMILYKGYRKGRSRGRTPSLYRPDYDKYRDNQRSYEYCQPRNQSV